jgi:predicted outer membrane protein
MECWSMKRALAFIAVAVIAALLWPSWAAAAVPAMRDGGVGGLGNGALPPGWKNTQWGLFGPGDQALLDNVRRADLWEGEQASVMGMEKGTTQQIKDVAKTLRDQHAELEAALKKIAAQLEVLLPTTPNSDQLGWLNEMRAASGKEFDQVWVDRLRGAHGKIFSIIATVRANTRNSLVRNFAITGNSVVEGHMALLEATGLVAYDHLPTPAAPPQANNGIFSSSTNTTTGIPPFVWVVLIVGVAGCIGAAIRLVRK